MTTEKAMFGAGCFWGVESAFSRARGVVSTAVGYAGGDFKNPTYENVSSGRTGHAEVVLVEFDPDQVSYGELLELFWDIHDPTTLNRQGPDRGSQYRSEIFYFTPEQEAIARMSLASQELSRRYQGPIVTQITAADDFWRAEEYHQRYNEKHGRLSCG